MEDIQEWRVEGCRCGALFQHFVIEFFQQADGGEDSTRQSEQSKRLSHCDHFETMILR